MMAEALSAPAPLVRAALPVLLCGAFAISFSGIFVRLSEIGPSATAFHRLFLALPALWLWLWLALERPEGGLRRPRTSSDAVSLVVCGLFLAADLILWHWSLLLTTVADAIVLSNTAPIFVTLAAWALLGERLTPVFLLGLAISVAGAGVLVAGGVSANPDNLAGDLLSLATAVAYAGYILSVKALRARFTAGAIMAWSGTVTCIAILPVALLSGESLLPASPYGWTILAGLALFSHAGGQGMIAWALAHLPASFSSVAMLMNPVTAALLAWPILGEPIGPWWVAGAAIVLAGVFMSRRGSAGTAPQP